MISSPMQISIGVLTRTLFPWHTGDNVPLALRGVDRVHVFKITVKDQH